MINYFYQLAPNTAPKQVRISRLNATHMNVSWAKLTLEEARGFITSYIVRYNVLEARRRKREVRVEVVDPDRSCKIIGGLGFTESYSITVSATTSAGEGIGSLAFTSQGKVNVSIRVLLVFVLSFSSSTILCLPTKNHWNK